MKPPRSSSIITTLFVGGVAAFLVVNVVAPLTQRWDPGHNGLLGLLIFVLVVALGPFLVPPWITKRKAPPSVKVATETDATAQPNSSMHDNERGSEPSMNPKGEMRLPED